MMVHVTGEQIIAEARRRGHVVIGERTFSSMLGAYTMLHTLGVKGTALRFGFDHWLAVKH